MAGDGLYNIDGQLLAVVQPCEKRFAALSVPSMGARLRRAGTFESRLVARSGLAVEPLTTDEATHFNTEQGVIVMLAVNCSRMG